MPGRDTPGLAVGLVLALLAGCAGPAGRTGAWIGDVTPRAPGPACSKTRGLAEISGDRLTFTPNEGTWLLVGTAEPGGRATAERIQPGANKLPYETRLEGRWTPELITATYTTPRCVFDVALKRR